MRRAPVGQPPVRLAGREGDEWVSPPAEEAYRDALAAAAELTEARNLLRLRNEGHAAVRHKDWHRCAHSRVSLSRKEDHKLSQVTLQLQRHRVARTQCCSGFQCQSEKDRTNETLLGTLDSCTVKNRISSMLFFLVVVLIAL